MTLAGRERAVGLWLLVCCLVLLSLITLGGATRLTGSGLSMVDWRPVTGFIPPLSESAWMTEFDAYRQSPEYLKVNRGMSIDEFKRIFWFEFAHRVLARGLGLVFALPLVFFWWRGFLSDALGWSLLGVLLLGAVQGYLGWYMVQSGLVDIPRVSPYRLAAHLSLALIIYGLIFWHALGLLWPRRATRPGFSKAFAALFGLLVLTILSGAFVAGLKAGLVYNTFPKMAGQWVPDGLLHLEPAWRNLFENPALVQFSHRVLGISTLLFGLGLFATAIGKARERAIRVAAAVVALACLVQVTLGISTLLLYVPVWLGTLHQGFAVILLSSVLVFGHLSVRSPSRVAMPESGDAGFTRRGGRATG